MPESHHALLFKEAQRVTKPGGFAAFYPIGFSVSDDERRARLLDEAVVPSNHKTLFEGPGGVLFITKNPQAFDAPRLSSIVGAIESRIVSAD